jgi:hypothetical protein
LDPEESDDREGIDSVDELLAIWAQRVRFGQDSARVLPSGYGNAEVTDGSLESQVVQLVDRTDGYRFVVQVLRWVYVHGNPARAMGREAELALEIFLAELDAQLPFVPIVAFGPPCEADMEPERGVETVHFLQTVWDLKAAVEAAQRAREREARLPLLTGWRLWRMDRRSRGQK